MIGGSRGAENQAYTQGDCPVCMNETDSPACPGYVSAGFCRAGSSVVEQTLDDLLTRPAEGRLNTRNWCARVVLE